jgi:hypothetical protein
MTNLFNLYFKSGFLLETATATKYENVYLFLPIALIIAVVAYRLFLFIKSGRPAVYKPFDRLWFWGYFVFALVGLLIWFSRTQALQFLSTRIVSYLWFLALFVYTGYLAFYFLKVIPGKLSNYYEKQRKSKYLSK